MSRKHIKLVENPATPEERLSIILPTYEANKSEMDAYKKLVDKDNKEIKEIMLGAKMDEFEFEDIRAKVSVSERTGFIEEALIDTIKEMKEKGELSATQLRKVIKKKEYVDMEALENAIYRGHINAAQLAGCQTVTEVVTLRVSKIKRK